jgi:hypothetical protein
MKITRLMLNVMLIVFAVGFITGRASACETVLECLQSIDRKLDRQAGPFNAMIDKAIQNPKERK